MRVVEQLFLLEDAQRAELVEQIRAGTLADVYLLSYEQQRLWLLDQLVPGDAGYNIAAAVRLRGELKVEALESALEEIIRRHESLRTSFVAINGEAVQVIDGPGALALSISITDVSEVPEREREQEVRRLADEEASRPFDLSRAPLLRVHLVRVGEFEHVLLLTMHHITSDGWSMRLLVREFNTLYGAHLAGVASGLPELPVQYADYAQWQREWLQGEELEKRLAYWRVQLKDLSTLNLPTDYPRPAGYGARGSRVSSRIGAELQGKIERLAVEQGATPFMVLLSGWLLLLSRYSGQQDIAIGTPIANRTQPEVEDLIGFFVNTLVMRVEVEAGESFVSLLGRVRKICLEAYTHQELPFEKLVEELQPDRDLGRHPLFQVMFSMQNAIAADELTLPGLSVQLEESFNGSAKFDLLLTLNPGRDGIAATLEYRTDLIQASTAERMLGHYVQLMEAGLVEPEQRVSGLEMLSAGERHQLLEAWNGTEHAYPQDRCIHQLFESQAAGSPDAVAVLGVAVLGQQQELTYKELNEKANQLAHQLRELGVGPEVLVGVCMERSLEMVIGLLGILKAGGAYVPLDPEYPTERLSSMLEDAQVAVILSQQSVAGVLGKPAHPLLSLDTDWPAISAHSRENPTPLATAQNLAYVIYTSGSTGKPKGAPNTHTGVVNRLLWMQQRYGVRAGERVLQKTPFSFDVSVWEFFLPLLSGGCLVLARAGGQKDAEYLSELIQQTGIQLLHFVPSMLDTFLLASRQSGLGGVRAVFSSGEALSYEVQQRFFEQSTARLYNLYGPTEAAIDVTSWECCREDSDRAVVPIGGPVWNTQVYVLDEGLGLVGVGVTGELYIGGVQLARGYLRQGGLTASRFVANPYGVRGSRMYRTGDLARWRPDGVLEFQGRTDEQIKIRGYRIEPGEIESVLREQAGVEQAVVLVREEAPGDRRLIAYCVVQAGVVLDFQQLRSALRQKLPEYMIPAGFVSLDQLPLTANGKLDRKALLASDASSPSSNFVSPRNEQEQLLMSVWEQVLGREHIGIHDNFFESGGHSLLATQLVSRIRRVFGVDLALQHLFETPTVGELAAVLSAELRRQDGPPAPPLGRREREESSPLSFAQQRMWFLQQLEPGNTSYNVPLVLRLKGDLSLEYLQQSLHEVVRRHESLRTGFVTEGGTPVQVIVAQEQAAIAVREVDLVAMDEAQQRIQVRELVEEEASRPFDLSRAPLLRVHLVRVGEFEHVLLLTMHHIVSDGWSMGLLERELNTLYGAHLAGVASGLPELPVQYADYAQWQREWLQGEELEKRLAYWRVQLKDLSTLNLPTDYPRPAGYGARGSRVSSRIGAELQGKIERLAVEQGATPFMVLLSGWLLLLSRYSGQQDIAIGTPIANRTQPEVEDLIGFFVNTLVMRVEVEAGESFVSLLGRVRKICLEAYTHQELPFEKLVEELQPDRDLGRHPLFQVMFSMQNAIAADELTLPGLSVQLEESFNGSAKFDLLLTLNPGRDGIAATLEYRTDLIQASTAERMLGHYVQLMEAGLVEPEQRVSGLEMLSAGERHQLLEAWNGTEHAYPQDRCIHQLFESQAAGSPDAVAVLGVAVLGQQQELTYKELNEKANQLAHQLRELGVGPEVLVGVCMERSLEMVIGLLGILKAGGAYVPLDPEYPTERLSSMLEDAQVAVILSQQSVAGVLGKPAHPLLSLDTDWPAISAHSRENPTPLATAQNLAYVIYTSGSTGKPKGAPNTHTGVVNRLLWMQQRYGVRAGERVLQKTPFSFDVSVWEFFLPLLSGGCLVLARAGGQKDAEYLSELIQQTGIQLLHFVPSMLDTFLLASRQSGLGGVRAVFSSGEALSYEVQQRFFEQSTARLYNLYGPTEAAIDVTSWECCREDSDRAVVPIGGPVWNTQVYVLDEGLGLVGVGVTGELYIGGVQLARGYLRQGGLTASRFVANPYGVRGSRMYRTGDLARWRPDGVLEFQGRTDEQIKIRGYRIEPGEIESVLREQAGVEQAVVLVREEAPGDRRLIAYCVVQAGVVLDFQQLRSALRQKLPEYMIPAGFVSLDQLPLTANGKLDRKALLASDASSPSSNFVSPRNPTEKLVSNLVVELLQENRIGITDNLFSLGLHSLTAIRLSLILSDLYQKDFAVHLIFLSPTVEGISSALASLYGNHALLDQVSTVLSE